MRLNTAQRLALNIDSHIVIDAGAGTGKTSTIVNRVIEHYLSEDQRATRLLPKPNRPNALSGGSLFSIPSDRMDLREWGGMLPGEVVLLTFTNRAADEMRDRLRKEISRLRPGPLGDDGKIRTDPRLRNEGSIEQIMMLLEDAPIGTIDSFLSRLVTPYWGRLGDTSSKGNVTDTGRNMLIESTLSTIWRLSNSPSKLGDAVDAGIPAEIVSEFLSARDRLSRNYSGTRAASRVIRGLASKSVFIDEVIRKITGGDGQIASESLINQILESIDESEISEFSSRLHSIVTNVCQIFKSHINSPSSVGWPRTSRIFSLDELDSNGPPEGKWAKLRWMGHVLICTVSKPSLLAKKMTFFPRNHFPRDSWDSGVDSYSKIKDRNTKESFLKSLKGEIRAFERLWSSERGQLMLHFVHASIILDKMEPPGTPKNWEGPSSPVPINIPDRPANSKEKSHFSLESEVRNLSDLYLIHLGFQGVLKKLKDDDELHDFEDMQNMAADLLLVKCPDVCRPFYHPKIQHALDSIGNKPWRDDHISRAFEILSELEIKPEESGMSSSILKAIRNDLEERHGLLLEIRRRYRAFIIDEAQDNSPLQWRIISRLWGPRGIEANESPITETPWQPTICYVGDVKQSIYAFRQAEVSGFLEFSKTLRSINIHELNSIPELTRKPALRRSTHSRDPRNDHTISIAKASEYMEKGGRDLVSWIPFDSTDRELKPPSISEINNRKEGMISLQVNYRTAGGLLTNMNEWWEDVFSSRHNLLKSGDFYASPQILEPSPENRKKQGSIEWICPTDNIQETDPSPNLTTYLDPFDLGEKHRLESQAMLIAMRVRSLIDASQIQVRSSEGSWQKSEKQEPVKPSEIMILLPNRVQIRDIITRHLGDMGIPVQVDLEGNLLERPTAIALEGLLQFVARPNSRHNAAWVARSCLIGFDDEQLQGFLGESKKNTNLLQKLESHCPSESQRSLVCRWNHLASSFSLIELLEETIDQSDLLVAYPEDSSRRDAEQFIEIVSKLSSEVGGDPIILADRIKELRESSTSPIVSQANPESDAVRLMTIHSSKGLESRVVIIADVFSNRQTNMRNEQNSRLIVTPELFAGNPNPWPSETNAPKSAMWRHVSLLQSARKDAEARRLLYVASTRAEEKLIIAGSPKGTKWIEGQGIIFPWEYDSPNPQLGQIWVESLRQGSIRRGETNSQWLLGHHDSSESKAKIPENLTLDPQSIRENAFIDGDGSNGGMTVIHHPECFIDYKGTLEGIRTPLQRIEAIDRISRNEEGLQKNAHPSSLMDSTTSVRIKPSKLPIFNECARRQWLETRGGLEMEPVIPNPSTESMNGRKMNLSPAEFGTIFHRIMEIGIGSPFLGGETLSCQLPHSWTKASDNRISDPELHKTVFEELLPPSANLNEVEKIVTAMSERIQDGKIGKFTEGKQVDGQVLEGLRTEMPFHITIPTKFNTVERNIWSPEGPEILAKFDMTNVEMSGVIDLVICSKDDEGNSAIRPIDLKTEGAESIFDLEDNELLATIDKLEPGPMSQSEKQILKEHRLQLALYYLALTQSEKDKEDAGIPHRTVLPPAILVGVTGRLIEYSPEMLEEALFELQSLLARSATISLASHVPQSKFPRLSGESASVCNKCPFSSGVKPICGPAE